MFIDEHKGTVWAEVRQQDIRVFARWLTPSIFLMAAVRVGLKEYRCF